MLVAYSSLLIPTALLRACACQELKEDFKEMTRWWKKLLPESDVSSVKVRGSACLWQCLRWCV